MPQNLHCRVRQRHRPATAAAEGCDNAKLDRRCSRLDHRYRQLGKQSQRQQNRRRRRKLQGPPLARQAKLDEPPLLHSIQRAMEILPFWLTTRQMGRFSKTLKAGKFSVSASVTTMAGPCWDARAVTTGEESVLYGAHNLTRLCDSPRFHFDCIGLSANDVPALEAFFCNLCSQAGAGHTRCKSPLCEWS